MGQLELDKKKIVEEDSTLHLGRRGFLTGAAGTALVAGLQGAAAFAADGKPVNLAKVAVPTSFLITSENKISALNDGFEPTNSRDREHRTDAIQKSNEVAGVPWIDCGWSKPVAINKVDIYWAVYPLRPKVFAGIEDPICSAVSASSRVRGRMALR